MWRKTEHGNRAHCPFLRRWLFHYTAFGWRWNPLTRRQICRGITDTRDDRVFIHRSPKIPESLQQQWWSLSRRHGNWGIIRNGFKKIVTFLMWNMCRNERQRSNLPIPCPHLQPPLLHRMRIETHIHKTEPGQEPFGPLPRPRLQRRVGNRQLHRSRAQRSGGCVGWGCVRVEDPGFAEILLSVQELFGLDGERRRWSEVDEGSGVHLLQEIVLCAVQCAVALGCRLRRVFEAEWGWEMEGWSDGAWACEEEEVAEMPSLQVLCGEEKWMLTHHLQVRYLDILHKIMTILILKCVPK